MGSLHGVAGQQGISCDIVRSCNGLLTAHFVGGM
jgi:hypothetical protein